MIKHILPIIILALSALGLGAQNLSLMSYNVRNARGMDGKQDLNRTAQVILSSKAQFVALQELDSITGRSAGVDILKELASITGMVGTYARAIRYDGGAYGIGLLSEKAPLSVERISLPGREEARVLLVAHFPNYVVLCTHFSLTPADQTESIEKIIQLCSTYKKPVFLLGDLNCEPQGEQFAQLKDHFVLLSNSSEPTFPADTPTQTIDYIWGSPQYKYRIKKHGVIFAPTQSDHRPIFVNFTYSKK